MTSKPRPKVQAAGTATGLVVVIAYVLRLVGVNVDTIPPEVLLAAGGALATAAAYVKRDGLSGTWDRLVHGERTP